MADFLLEWQFGTHNVFCASGHDTYAYRMSLMYVHLGGGAWIFNIPGGAIESTGNTFLQLSQEGIGNNCNNLC